LKFVLDNGLRVMVVERAGSQVVELRFVFEGGFAADPRELSGVARIATAMFSEGALRAGSARLGVAQEALGATLRGRVTADGAVVEMSALAGHHGDALIMAPRCFRIPSSKPNILSWWG
jgi:zinc protease